MQIRKFSFVWRRSGRMIFLATALFANVAWVMGNAPAAAPSSSAHPAGLPFSFPLITNQHRSAMPVSPPAQPDTESAKKGAGFNASLHQSADLLANSNLLAKTGDGKLVEPKPHQQMIFDLARDQRAQKSYSLAAKNFATVIGMTAPDELKRQALIELALMAHEQNELAKAQQIFSQYIKRWPDDPSVPEVLLRQGLLYRQMGAPALALGKFYEVMTSSLTLKFGSIDYYKRLVLHAQTEIADTHFLEGKLEDATELFARLVKQASPELNHVQIEYKLVRCHSGLNKSTETIAQAQDFLARNPAAQESAEVRFLLAASLKQVGRNRDALQQVLLLLQSQQGDAESNPDQWNYWRRRAGNEIANQLYLEGDYLAALEIYLTLAALDPSPAWQLPVWYQIGLAYEKLQQPQKAGETYARITARHKELADDAGPGLRAVIDMAKWRSDFLNWQTQTALSRLGTFPPAPIPPPTPQ